jgi:hypothetical protein
LWLFFFFFLLLFSFNSSFFQQQVDHVAIVSEFTADTSTHIINPSSERIITTFFQPYGNHDGGQILFGPDDGYLYILLGDGGSGGDPLKSGQRATSPLGKVLRIDIDNKDPGLEYAIPSDNPWPLSAVPEAYAMGVRNPWRCSWDRTRTPALLICGDVGQGEWEMVHTVQNARTMDGMCGKASRDGIRMGSLAVECMFNLSWRYAFVVFDSFFFFDSFLYILFNCLTICVYSTNTQSIFTHAQNPTIAALASVTLILFFFFLVTSSRWAYNRKHSRRLCTRALFVC